MADRRPLIRESSALSDTASTHALPSPGFSPRSRSFGFSTVNPYVSPPSSPPKSISRPGYERIQSDATAAGRRNEYANVLHEEDEEDSISDTFSRRSGSGLGIGSPGASQYAASKRVSIQTIPRVPVGAMKSPSIRSPSFTLSPPGTGDPLMGGFPRDSAGSTPDLRRERLSPKEDTGGYKESGRGVLKKSRSSESGDYQRFIHEADTQRLHKGSPSIKSAYEVDFRPNQECPTQNPFYHPSFTWLSITVIIICLFSTVFSGIFLGLAWKGPRYGKTITTHGSLKPADAIVLTSVMAKLIELSFVTSFVAFLGQVLSRRAFMKDHGRGVTLSELSMWRWVVQPGVLITHWETAKYAGITVLGILSLLSAVLSTLYAPAATALVQPSLRFGSWDHRILVGQVKSSFSNTNYIKEICETPIRSDTPEIGGSTCLQIEHAAQGYHNYQRYLASWNKQANRGNGTTDQSKRPPGFGLLHENTSITAQWINIIDTKEISRKYKRAINNVSLAMPHSGVFQAARDQRNGILQPEELNSEGIYFLRASVPSPVMHVLCANMEKEELAPIVYDEWHNNETVDINNWPILSSNVSTKNTTKVDKLFGWTKKDDVSRLDYPPVFARLPMPFNTIMNHTSFPWGRDTIYLLGQGGADATKNYEGQYFLCQVKVSMTPFCSTEYNATGSGGSMGAYCEDENDNMAYIKSLSNATQNLRVSDWKDIGFDWSNSMSLNTGIMDANASNSRLLTQLILQKNNDGDYDLSPALPSPAEALAVMSGCTILMGALDTPFVEFWNYTQHILMEPQSQYFNAMIKDQQYGSGGTDQISKGWLVVLLLVFLLNIFVLAYFLSHRGLVTDFSEPPNLFALAVNSPPSYHLAGSCGGGPDGKQYKVNWFVNTEGDHLYMESGEKGEVYEGEKHVHGMPHLNGNDGMPDPSCAKLDEGKGGVFGFFGVGWEWMKSKVGGFQFGDKKEQGGNVWTAGAMDLEMDGEHTSESKRGSRTKRQFDMLAKRRSML